MEEQVLYQETAINPYVSRLEKMLYSMEHLASEVSLSKENKVQLTGEEIKATAMQIRGQVCAGCDSYEICGGRGNDLYMIVYEVLKSIDDYGNELSVETKRKLQRQCIRSGSFLIETKKAFEQLKQTHIWELRIREKQRQCGQMVETFAHSLYGAAKEINASICVDKYLENRIRKFIVKQGVRLMELQIFRSGEGRYIIEFRGRMAKGNCISLNQMVRQLSALLGRDMIMTSPTGYVLRDDYACVRLEEKPVYGILYGAAKRCKEGNNISGDNFLAVDLANGKKVVALSDGMGSGEKAYLESKRMIELLEELLEAGFTTRAAVAMVNQTMLLSNGEIMFSTLDLCQWNLYSGEVEILKAGATKTYIRSGSQVRKCCMSALPLGVLSDIALDTYRERLQHGDYVIMMTDGVEEALPQQEREFLLEMIIGGMKEQNPSKMAEGILEQVQGLSRGGAKDDMMVLVAGMWRG